MEKETERRITRLEEEVRALRFELDEIKGIKAVESKALKEQKEKPILIEKKQALQSNEHENHLVQLNRAAQSKVKKTPIEPSYPEKSKVESNSQQQRSFEEMVIWALPKVFMVILVLGVLWGLKLISDYGLFSNSVKIALAYILSIGLIVISFLMEKRKKDSSNVFTVVLYGGAFIIGILTTAAGAILYEVMGLYVALSVAILYIVYGITISYLKKNEVLSVFVIFTSLLLPYLLEYMEFNGAVILMYVLLVFSAMQLVFLKHQQRISLYVAYFFSIIAIQIIWGLNHQNEMLFSISYLLINTILLIIWWKLYKPFGKYRALHEGILFSLSGLTIFMINVVSEEAELTLLLLAIIFGVFTFFAYKRSESRIVDITGTITLLTMFNILIIANLTSDVDTVLYPLSAFIGLMLALRINGLLMKISYSFIFVFTILIQLIIIDVTPFWSIEHFNYLLILGYILVIFLYSKRQIQGLMKKEEKQALTFTNDFYPIFILLYFFLYVLKIDYAYIADYHAYFTMLLLAIVMVISLFISERYIGRIVRYALIIVFAFTMISLLPPHYVDGLEMWLNLLVRLIYATVIIAIIADVYMEGYLYKNWIYKMKINLEGLLSVGIIASMFMLYSILNQLEVDQIINYYIVVSGKTILLFVTATIALWLSSVQKLQIIRTIGYILLAIAILKLIFFDLASLNLLIRALLFISIGGIGLLLSNRLLKNNPTDGE